MPIFRIVEELSFARTVNFANMLEEPFLQNVGPINIMTLTVLHRVDLIYYVSKHMDKGKWLKYFLEHLVFKFYSK